MAKQRRIPLLNFLNYNTEKAKEALMNFVDWQGYDCRHGESYLTRFFQNYFLPKISYEKRNIHLSSLIISGEITRDEALLKTQEPPYNKTMFIKDTYYNLRDLS